METHRDGDRVIIDTADFVFGPSGAYFNPALLVVFEGEWVQSNPDIALYDENGEAMEYRRSKSDTKIKIEVPHFSRYAYDAYDYY